MIPVFGTAAVLIAPSAPLLSSGYVPGNPLGAQHFNWYLYHLTAELNNVLSAQGLSQSTADDSQVLKAIGRTNVLISTSGTITTASQFAGNMLVQFANLSGSSNYVITAGAARPGIELIVESLAGSGVMIVNGSGSAFLGSGAVRLLWDGSAWCKIGGNAFLQTFTSGSAQTWFTPWKGSYKCIVTGGGGGGGGTSGTTLGAGGTGGATAISVITEMANAALVYTVGLGGSGAASTAPGSSGTSSLINDGTNILTGTGGTGGSGSAGNILSGTPGPSAVGGQININGGDGGPAYFSLASGTTGQAISGYGGGSIYGPGARFILMASSGTQVAGINATVDGAGGSGAVGGAGSAASGGNGMRGRIVIEY